ncbi:MULTISPECIES: hypothetical protein [Providencia]|nr:MULTISPECIES: hypothetical protein [Providencia]ELR5145375.1 hypothetical protein [Providencia rettgeri]NIA43256.1 hypothetical protein [Providencia rettgeri]NIA96251.1 hypothetical protein [Providencia rettgeri]NIB14074.1 hypothetical protein [Providencia rettgeri]NIB33917.1 hypothetical protein [Providencia rettgeri]
MPQIYLPQRYPKRTNNQTTSSNLSFGSHQQHGADAALPHEIKLPTT